jgi:hypothetical protein
MFTYASKPVSRVIAHDLRKLFNSAVLLGDRTERVTIWRSISIKFKITLSLLNGDQFPLLYGFIKFCFLIHLTTPSQLQVVVFGEEMEGIGRGLLKLLC